MGGQLFRADWWAGMTKLIVDFRNFPNAPKKIWFRILGALNPLNTELNPVCHLLALLGDPHILHISKIRLKVLAVWCHSCDSNRGFAWNLTSLFRCNLCSFKWGLRLGYISSSGCVVYFWSPRCWYIALRFMCSRFYSCSICGSNGRVVALRKSRGCWLRRRSAHEICKATK